MSTIPQLYADFLVNKSLAQVFSEGFPIRATVENGIKEKGAGGNFLNQIPFFSTELTVMLNTTRYILPHGESVKSIEHVLNRKLEPEQVEETEDFILFGAGPAKLPKQVLRQIQAELLDYAGTHQSILEISHRSPEFMAVNNGTIQKAKDLLNIPDNYKVLFMQGGGTGMFSAVPMNLIGKTGKADYIVTGSWSAKAAKEATKHGKVNVLYPKQHQYGHIPPQGSWNLDPEAAYVYCCANETVDGVEFQDIPETNGVPLVADMSSNIFSRPLDVSKFGLIFGGAQKNIGPSGVTIVIIREDLMGNALKYTPTVFDFATIAKDNSLYNTPPSFAIYAMNLVFDWILANGGVEEMETRAIKKSSLVYKTIEESAGFYTNHVQESCRSRMNVVFRIKNDEELENDFVKQAKGQGLLGLKGHRSVGGIRASIYNAVLPEHTERLVEFMIKFQEKYQNEKQ